MKATIKRGKLPAAPYPKTPVIRPKPREPEGIPIVRVEAEDEAPKKKGRKR